MVYTKGKGLDLGRSLPPPPLCKTLSSIRLGSFIIIPMNSPYACVHQTTRFEIVKLRQGNRVERNTHAQRLEMRRILLTNDGGSVVKLAYLT